MQVNKLKCPGKFLVLIRLILWGSGETNVCFLSAMHTSRFKMLEWPFGVNMCAIHNSEIVRSSEL